MGKKSWIGDLSKTRCNIAWLTFPAPSTAKRPSLNPNLEGLQTALWRCPRGSSTPEQTSAPRKARQNTATELDAFLQESE